MRISRLFSGLLLSVVLSSLLATAMPAGRAHAAVRVKAAFLNHYAIVLSDLAITQDEVNNNMVDKGLLDQLGLDGINQHIAAQLHNVQLIDDDMTDDKEQYVFSNNGCESQIKFQENAWEFIQISILVSGSGCKEVMPGSGVRDLVLGPRTGSGQLDTSKEGVWFTWQTQNSMTRVDGKDGEFVEDPLQPGKYFRVEETGESDQDYVAIAPTTLNDSIPLDGGHYFRDEDVFAVQIDGQENKTKPPSTANPTTGGSGSGGDSCENNSGALGWILCPIINALDSALGWLDTRIQRLLAIDENKYTDPALRQVWVQMRNLAYILLIPAMLIMVIGTALGFEVFSAYTIKKALPRMVIAVIFITFSWHICLFLITFFNVVGAGVVGLLTAPFAQATGGIKELTLSSLLSGNNFAESFIGSATIGIGIAVLIWLFLGTIVGITLIAFLVLLLRQMFIVGLILLAPFAILAWIFPGNDKPWKFWWVSFTRLLMMFPLIMAVIALGRIFAWMIMEGGAGFGDAILSPFMAVVAWTIPYAFIPFTFKLAGGFFATLTGMVNDKGKGFFDRQSQKRAGKISKAKNFEAAGDRNRLARGVSSTLGAVMNPKAAVRGRSGIRAARQAGRTNLGTNAFKEDPTIVANQNDDAFLLALAHRGMAEQKLAQAKARLATATTPQDRQEAMAEIANRERALSAASQVQSRNSVATRMAAAQALAATGYQLSADEEGYNELSTIMHDLTGTDSGAYTAAMNQAQYNLKNAGRFDLAGINHGAGYDRDAGLDKADPFTLGRAKKETARSMGAGARAKMAAGDIEGASVLRQELQSIAQSATGAARDEALLQSAILSGDTDYIDAHVSDPTKNAQAKAQAASVAPALSAWERTATGKTRVKRENYVPGVPLPLGAPAWTADEMKRGWRMREAPETNRDLASDRARTARMPREDD